jgi:hypothetical protein
LGIFILFLREKSSPIFQGIFFRFFKKKKFSIFSRKNDLNLDIKFGCGHPPIDFGYPNKKRMGMVIKPKYNYSVFKIGYGFGYG